MLTVFHISDLHYTAAKSGQLRDAASAAVKALLELGKTLVDRGTVGADVCLFITGDLVQSGVESADNLESDFDAVQRDLLGPLLQILKIAPERVFMVPGNHEMDRDSIADEDRLLQGQYVEQKICEADVHKDLVQKLAGYFSFIEKNGYKSVTRLSPRIETFPVSGQQVVCLNGLVGSYSRKGYGDKGELFFLGSEYANCLSRIEDNAIILTHHPLAWYADNCSTNLKDLFSQKQVRLLSGHIHDEGIEWIETLRGGFAAVQAGATAEIGTLHQVAVGWFPDSNSAAVRHYEFDPKAAKFSLPAADSTKTAPKKAEEFFRRTKAFFDPQIIEDASQHSIKASEAELAAASGKPSNEFVSPDIAIFIEDQFSSRRVTVSDIIGSGKNSVVSGDELSGKSSLLHFINLSFQKEAANPVVGIALDFRSLEAGHKLDEIVFKRLRGFGLSNFQADYLLEIGRVGLCLDNFDPNSSQATTDFLGFAARYPLMRWTIATRGDERYMPSRAPAAFSKEGVSYYQLTETTLPTVLKMIQNHGDGKKVEKPRAVVEQVFRSINNLRAPRTIFYVNSLVDVFLSDASVEPLNRYLLIENLLSDRIRSAHREQVPGQPVDMEMLETFIGQIAHRLMVRSEPYLSKASFYTLVEEFVNKKGIQKKRFDADVILKILLNSFVLRDYEFGYGFMMLSIEDYFLAKHMGKDADFRSQIMSPEGLLSYPSVAEFYVAQNPSDQPRIENVLTLLETFESEVASVVEAIKVSSIEAYRTASPGAQSKVQEELVEMLATIDGTDEPTSLKFDDPKPVGRTKRMSFAAEERGAVFLQLGASILGVTRTLDQDDRVKIFKRLRGVLLTSLYSMPLIAQHLADGNEVKFRGVTIKADYVGDLAVQENRFYIILRGMVFSLFKNFATWAGSPSFFNAAVDLRKAEEDELVKAALFAQNVEADLSEAIAFIPDIPKEVDSFLLKEILVRIYLDTLTLVPLERDDEARAVNRLADVAMELNPPPAGNRALADSHRNNLRKSYSEKIGYNAYIGRIPKTKRSQAMLQDNSGGSQKP